MKDSPQVSSCWLFFETTIFIAYVYDLNLVCTEKKRQVDRKLPNNQTIHSLYKS